MIRVAMTTLTGLILLSSCSEKKEWTMAELAGTYTVAPKERSLMERWFSRSNVTGWDYDNMLSVQLRLNADSTYRQTMNGGGGFEIIPSEFSGTWSVQGDSILLERQVQLGSSRGQPTRKVRQQDFLFVNHKGDLVTMSLPNIAKGKVLVRR